MDLLEKIIDTLATPEALPPKNEDHDLKGNYINKRECHITPDWLLIYRVEGDRLMLYRTGTHADLFSKRGVKTTAFRRYGLSRLLYKSEL